MKWNWRILYKPPEEKEINNDPNTWRKVWLFSKYDCPEQLDLDVAILKLIRDYKLKKEYIIVQILNEDGSVEYDYHYIDNE